MNIWRIFYCCSSAFFARLDFPQAQKHSSQHYKVGQTGGHSLQMELIVVKFLFIGMCGFRIYYENSVIHPVILYHTLIPFYKHIQTSLDEIFS